MEIEVDFTDLKPHMDQAYKTIANQVNIPGFRKGKVPATLIDQRVGRGAVLEEAINKAIPEFYAKAAQEHDVPVIGRPEVDIKELNDGKNLTLTVEVDVRPTITLPDLSSITIPVDDAEITDAAIDEQIDGLRARFGTLHGVERPAAAGDFVSIDLIARVNGEEIEGGTAKNISYEVGTNRMIDGLDDALLGMSAGETRTFNTTLLGDQEGQESSVEVTLHSVKVRELPAVDDAFAEMASEFDTVAELREDVKTRLGRVRLLEQGAQARDRLVEHLLSAVEIPVPEGLVEAEIHDHLEAEGRLEDAEHRAEVDTQVRESLRSNFLLDTIVKQEGVDVSEAELSEYLVRSAARYGMTPDQFVQEVVRAGQVNAMVGEVARAKALATVLEKITVKDASGRPVDLEALRPTPEVAADDAE
jgi:trigger factor